MSGVTGALRLGLFGVAVAGVLASIDSVTHKRIEANTQRAIIKSLIDVTADPRLATLTGSVAPPLAICRPNGELLYNVRGVSTPGYGGPISLLVAIDRTDRVTGVRVVRHHETPGIGDVIEPSRSGWILGFGGRAATQRSDSIDAVTGATITTRAVIRAVGAAAIDNKEDLPVRCTHVLSD